MNKSIARLLITALLLTLLACLSACSEGERTVTVAPTCTESGLAERSGFFGMRTEEPIPPTGHTPRQMEDTVPTCSTDGSIGGTSCVVCGEILQAPTRLPAAGHRPVPLGDVPPTCTSAGSRGGSCCSVCGETIDPPTVLLPLDHTPVVTPGTPPTCTKEGVSQSSICAACGQVLETAQPLPAHGHKWEVKSLASGDSSVDAAAVFRCTYCAKTDTRAVSSTELGVPILRLDGDLSLESKGEAAVLSLTYESPSQSFACRVQMTIQGGTSAKFEKKNYNIRLLREDGSKYRVRLDADWGWQSKYCLKANYIDFTQARNIVSGRIYASVVASRAADDPVSRLPNGGVVDGFPVAVYLNGSFYGLYTLNIPKDEWMFGMNGGEDSHQAVLMGADWTSTVALRKKLPESGTENWDGMDLVFCSTEDTPEGTDWVNRSFNAMIDFVTAKDGAAFRKGIDQYINVERAIDAFLFTVAFHGNDNVSKNILWATWDGEIWMPSPYDMDDSWGLVWNGEQFYPPDDFGFAEVASRNALWEKLWKLYRPQIKARWAELREGPMKAGSIRTAFSSFIGGIPDCLYDADAACWNSPSEKTSTYAQISEYTSRRFKWLDSRI